MYSSKLSISKRFSMSVTWYILYILPCSVNFHNIVKEPGRVSFPGTFELSAFIWSCWFSWDILWLTKSPPENLDYYVPEIYCLDIYVYTKQNFFACNIWIWLSLSVLFIQWQVCKSFGTTFTPVNDKALQMFSSKTSSVISAGTGFNSIVSLYWEFVTALCSSYVILVGKWELNFWHCCNSQLTLSYFDKKSLNFSSRLLSFVLMSLMKLELISVSSWMTSS